MKARVLHSMVPLCLVASQAVADPSQISGPSSNGQPQAVLQPIKRGGAVGGLREESVSDKEVREIQKLIAEKVPGTILNIGPVTVGCGCTEQAACGNQVALIVSRTKRTGQIMLVRVGDAWQLSEEQKWQLRREDLSDKMRMQFSVPEKERKAFKEELERERRQLISDQPKCRSDVKPAPARKS